MMQKIPRRHQACSKCSGRFQPGQPLTSVLSVSLSDDYVRADFCLVCWQSGEDEEGLQGVWKSYYPIPEQEERSETSDDRRILNLLLDSLDEPLKAYVLALYLVRRGMLQRLRHPGGARSRMLLFEVKATGECLEVPQLSHTEAAQADLELLR